MLNFRGRKCVVLFSYIIFLNGLNLNTSSVLQNRDKPVFSDCYVNTAQFK